MAPPLKPSQRLQIIELKDEGYRIAEISKRIGVARKTIHFWLKRWNETGELTPRHRQTYKRATTDEQDAALIAAHMADPSRSTTASSQEFNISQDTVRRRLKEFKEESMKKQAKSIPLIQRKLKMTKCSKHLQSTAQIVKMTEQPSYTNPCYYGPLDDQPSEVTDAQATEIETPLLLDMNLGLQTANSVIELKSPLTKRTRKKQKFEPESQYCSKCGDSIESFRYVCLQCCPFELCARCGAEGVHAQHYLLRLPLVHSQRKAEAVIAEVRRVLVSGDQPMLQPGFSTDFAETAVEVPLFEVQEHTNDPLKEEPPDSDGDEPGVTGSPPPSTRLHQPPLKTEGAVPYEVQPTTSQQVSSKKSQHRPRTALEALLIKNAEDVPVKVKEEPEDICEIQIHVPRLGDPEETAASIQRPCRPPDEGSRDGFQVFTHQGIPPGEDVMGHSSRKKMKLHDLNS